MKHQIIKIRKIVAGFYTSDKQTNSIVIYAIGAPLTGDMGKLVTAPMLLSRGFDIFVPDYIGYCRSEGKFTPKNCIKTFLESYEYVRGGQAIDVRTGEKLRMSYKNVLFIGSSFGGAYVPLLPRFNPKIKNLAMLYPVTDYNLCGTMKGEESINDFMRSMEYGYKYLYRGIMHPIWQKHFKNQDGLSPIDNLDFLKNAKVFIAHGKKDKCINYQQSLRYFDFLKKQHPQSIENYKLVIYPQGAHDKTTSIPAVRNLCQWLKR